VGILDELASETSFLVSGIDPTGTR
jgi:hypothetical protein